MLHVSFSSQTLRGGRNAKSARVACLGLTLARAPGFHKFYDFVVSGVRWYNRSPELYLLGYKYSTLVGGLTAALSYSANHTHEQ